MLENNLNPHVVDDLKSEYWEVSPNVFYWSSAFLKKIGYEKVEIKEDIIYFLKHLIHDDYREAFRDSFFNYIKNESIFDLEILIKCKHGKYKEFRCYSSSKTTKNNKKKYKYIFFKERKLVTDYRVKNNAFFYRESAEMTKTGSWFIDFLNQKSYWDQQTRKILEYPEDYLPSLKDAGEYYAEEHHELATSLFSKCAMSGTSFNTEMKMLTANKRKIWVRATGKPVYNIDKEIIGIRGVFQDIDDEKSKILALQKTSDIIASQNSRLFNFAHIVSHNLRSHTSNLTLITELIDSMETLEEKLEMMGNIKKISESLNTTINHLNDVVTIQTQTHQNKVEVSFEDTLNYVKKSIGEYISVSKTKFIVDFSELPSLEYIPAYLESILLNLVTNAIKYKHASRDPEITIKTYIKNKKKYLEIQDNGIGIDMNKYGNKLFGMYQTFHFNKDAVGIGLFITKNQIESLNGHIHVDSEVDKGSIFKIKF